VGSICPHHMQQCLSRKYPFLPGCQLDGCPHCIDELVPMQGKVRWVPAGYRLGSRQKVRTERGRLRGRVIKIVTQQALLTQA
jgi:hypothetical protein